MVIFPIIKNIRLNLTPKFVYWSIQNFRLHLKKFGKKMHQENFDKKRHQKHSPCSLGIYSRKNALLPNWRCKLSSHFITKNLLSVFTICVSVLIRRMCVSMKSFKKYVFFFSVEEVQKIQTIVNYTDSWLKGFECVDFRTMLHEFCK